MPEIDFTIVQVTLCKMHEIMFTKRTSIIFDKYTNVGIEKDMQGSTVS